MRLWGLMLFATIGLCAASSRGEELLVKGETGDGYLSQRLSATRFGLCGGKATIEIGEGDRVNRSSRRCPPTDGEAPGAYGTHNPALERTK